MHACLHIRVMLNFGTTQGCIQCVRTFDSVYGQIILTSCEWQTKDGCFAQDDAIQHTAVPIKSMKLMLHSL